MRCAAMPEPMGMALLLEQPVFPFVRRLVQYLRLRGDRYMVAGIGAHVGRPLAERFAEGFLPREELGDCPPHLVLMAEGPGAQGDDYGPCAVRELPLLEGLEPDCDMPGIRLYAVWGEVGDLVYPAAREVDEVEE